MMKPPRARGLAKQKPIQFRDGVQREAVTLGFLVQVVANVWGEEVVLAKLTAFVSKQGRVVAVQQGWQGVWKARGAHTP